MGLQALDEIAPSLAAAWAARLFLSPPRHAAPAREREALRAGRFERVRVPGRSLATWSFGRGPTVLLVHGWGGRGGQMSSFVPALLERGFGVVAFDGPGHGRSSGRTASVPEFAGAILALDRALGPFASVVAHSMGAPATVLALGRGLRAPSSLVLLGSPRNPGAYFGAFQQALRLSGGLAARTQARLERRLGVSFDELDMTGRRSQPLPPALLVHDEQDAEVSWSDSAAVASAWGATLLTTRGLGHRKLLRDPATVAAAVRFLSEHVERCQGCRAPVPARSACDACELSRYLFTPALRRAA